MATATHSVDQASVGCPPDRLIESGSSDSEKNRVFWDRHK